MAFLRIRAPGLARGGAEETQSWERNRSSPRPPRGFTLFVTALPLEREFQLDDGFDGAVGGGVGEAEEVAGVVFEFGA